MTNRPPLPGTYDPKDWKCPSCKTLNFKKRQSCLSCATPKPVGVTEVIKDWRMGKKDLSENFQADWTCRLCQQFNVAAEKSCRKCGGPCPPKTSALNIAESVEARSGRAAGHFDRPDPEEPRNNWNSDEEDIDEFGRKKARKKESAADRQKAALERLRKKGAARRRSRSRSR